MSVEKEIREFLGNVLRVEDSDFIQAVLNCASVKEYKSGKPFCEEGEPAAYIGFLMNDGLLRGFYTDASDREVNVCFMHGVGECVLGNNAMLGNAAYTIEAIENSKVLRIPLANIEGLLKRYPECERVAFRYMATANEWHLDMQRILSQFRGEERVRQFEKAYPDLSKRLPVAELASFLGVNERTVYRSREK